MKESLIRFVIGGLVVSAFSIVADALKPKSFAGLLGAAPSVALATLGLTVMKSGAIYASIEARSMIVGAFAFLIYAWMVAKILLKGKWSALSVTACSLLVWFGSSFGIWYVALR
jgi:hypothetical protein